jgi:glycogen synthase
MDKLEQFDNFNFLKGGLVYSDILTTVSRKYAEEVQTPEFGNQLDSGAAGASGGSARDSERRGLHAVEP